MRKLILKLTKIDGEIDENFCLKEQAAVRRRPKYQIIVYGKELWFTLRINILRGCC